MTIPASIFFFVIGAILYFAVTDTVSGIKLATVGIILMGASAVGLVLGLIQQNAGRRQVTERHVESDVDGTHERVERHY